jgi:lipopolysaccharide biosynthesis glycosyltransferase
MYFYLLSQKGSRTENSCFRQPRPGRFSHMYDDMRSAQMNVVLISNEDYALGLAAALASIVSHTCPPPTFYVIDMGITLHTKQRLAGIAPITWLDPSSHYLPETPAYASKATWAKLLLPHLLPSHVQQVLYFDADMIALKDIAGIWNYASDTACSDLTTPPSPTPDSSGCITSTARPTSALQAASNSPDTPSASAAQQTPPQASSQIQHSPPAAIYAVRDFGIPSGHRDLSPLGWHMTSSYFNAGLMLIDIPAYTRKLPLLQQLMTSPDAQRRLRWHDQDALNIAFQGGWALLPVHWNAQGLGTYASDRVHASRDRPALLSQEECDELHRAPSVVHFTGGCWLGHACSGSWSASTANHALCRLADRWQLPLRHGLLLTRGAAVAARQHAFESYIRHAADAHLLQQCIARSPAGPPWTSRACMVHTAGGSRLVGTGSRQAVLAAAAACMSMGMAARC